MPNFVSFSKNSLPQNNAALKYEIVQKNSFSNKIT